MIWWVLDESGFMKVVTNVFKVILKRSKETELPAKLALFGDLIRVVTAVLVTHA